MLDLTTRRFSEEFTQPLPARSGFAPLETKQTYKKNQRLLTGFTLFEGLENFFRPLILKTLNRVKGTKDLIRSFRPSAFRMNPRGNIGRKTQRGFTLFEVALAMAVFALAASGSLSLFISCTRLTDSAGHITRMVERAREELENRIRRTDFESLDDYFFITNDPLPLSLVCYVEGYDSVNPNNELNRLLKMVKIVITYRETSNRIIGEDRNLNGRLDDGEDTNGDNRISSPCEIVTFIARRE